MFHTDCDEWFDIDALYESIDLRNQPVEPTDEEDAATTPVPDTSDPWLAYDRSLEPAF